MPFDPNSITKLFSLTPEQISAASPEMAMAMSPELFLQSLTQAAPPVNPLAAPAIPQGQGATPQQAGSWANMLGLKPQVDSPVLLGSPSNLAAGGGQPALGLPPAAGGMPQLTQEQMAMLAQMAAPSQMPQRGGGAGGGSGGRPGPGHQANLQSPDKRQVLLSALLAGGGR